MQKVALRAQLRSLRLELESLRLVNRYLGEYNHDVRRRLQMARAGLLIALPHVAHPSARLLVAVSLDESAGNPGEFEAPV